MPKHLLPSSTGLQLGRGLLSSGNFVLKGIRCHRHGEVLVNHQREGLGTTWKLILPELLPRLAL
jgi:hypothetical protein